MRSNLDPYHRSATEIREDNDRHEAEMLASLQAFQEWIFEIREEGHVHSTENMIVDLDEMVAKRFCLGIAGDRLFFGVQEHELKWFMGMPWVHVAIKPGDKNICFVAAENIVAGISVPPFALSIHTDSRDKTTAVSRAQSIDIRKINVQDGFVNSISRQVLTVLDVVHVSSDRNLHDLFAGVDSSPKRYPYNT